MHNRPDDDEDAVSIVTLSPMVPTVADASEEDDNLAALNNTTERRTQESKPSAPVKLNSPPTLATPTISNLNTFRLSTRAPQTKRLQPGGHQTCSMATLLQHAGAAPSLPQHEQSSQERPEEGRCVAAENPAFACDEPKLPRRFSSHKTALDACEAGSLVLAGDVDGYLHFIEICSGKTFKSFLAHKEPIVAVDVVVATINEDEVLGNADANAEECDEEENQQEELEGSHLHHSPLQLLKKSDFTRSMTRIRSTPTLLTAAQVFNGVSNANAKEKSSSCPAVNLLLTAQSGQVLVWDFRELLATVSGKNISTASSALPCGKRKAKGKNATKKPVASVVENYPRRNVKEPLVPEVDALALTAPNKEFYTHPMSPPALLFYDEQEAAYIVIPRNTKPGAKPISEQEYISAPPKGSSGFLAEQDRRAIYAAFLRYSTMLKERQEWDICDAAAQIWDRSMRYRNEVRYLARLDELLLIEGGANENTTTCTTTGIANVKKINKKKAGAKTKAEDCGKATFTAAGASVGKVEISPVIASSRVSCLLCDEAQDLLPCQLLLFQIVCGPNTECAFAGDTAQTIHFGRSFRFADLKDLWWKHFARPMNQLSSPAFRLPLLLLDDQRKALVDEDHDSRKQKKLSKQKQRAMKANKARSEAPAATSTKNSAVTNSSCSELLGSGKAAAPAEGVANKKLPLDAGGTTKVQFLTKNFRTHQGVLDFAALVVDVLHEFFDRSVDRMPRETSTTSGVPPYLVCGLSRTDFVAKLFGTTPLSTADEANGPDDEHEKSLLLAGEGLKNRPGGVSVIKNASPPYAPSADRASAGTLGADQVILVQSEDGKRDVLAHFGPGVVVLTVCDSKGLEFDDVILWNFFSESDCDEKCWLRLYDYMEREVERLVEGLVTTSTSTSDKNEAEGESRAPQKNSAGASASGSSSANAWLPEDVQRREDERSRLLAQVEFLREGRALARNSRKTDPGSMWWSQWATALKILYVGVTRAKKKILLYETAPLTPGSAAKAAKDFFADSRVAFGVSEKAAMRWADISVQDEGDESAADVALSAFVQRSDEGAYVSRGHEFFQRGLYREAKNMYAAGNEHKLAQRAEARSIAEQNGAHGDAALLLEEAGFFEEAAENFEKGGDVLRVLECLDKTEDGEMILSKLEQMRLALAEASYAVGGATGKILEVKTGGKTDSAAGGGEGGSVIVEKAKRSFSAGASEQQQQSESGGGGSATGQAAGDSSGGLTAAVSRLGSDEVEDLRAAIGRLWAKYSFAAKEAARYDQLRTEYASFSFYPADRGASGFWGGTIDGRSGGSHRRARHVDLNWICVPPDVNTLEDLARLFLIHKPKGETAEFLPAVLKHYPNTQKARLKTLLGKLRREMAEGGVLAQLKASDPGGSGKRVEQAVSTSVAEPRQAAPADVSSRGFFQFEEFSPEVQAVIASKPKFLSSSNSKEVAKLFAAASTSFGTRLQVKRTQRRIAELEEQAVLEQALLESVSSTTAAEQADRNVELEVETRRLQKQVGKLQASAAEAEETMDAALAPLRSDQLVEVYFEAARKGLLSLVQKLILDKHMSIYTRESKTGNTILHATVSSRRKELLKWLLGTECYGMLALRGRKRGFASGSEDERAILASRWVCMKNKRGETALLLSVRTGELCIANEFFDHADFASWAWGSLLRPVARKIASREHCFLHNEGPKSPDDIVRKQNARAAVLPPGYCSDNDSDDSAESGSSREGCRTDLSDDDKEEMFTLHADRLVAKQARSRRQDKTSRTTSSPESWDTFEKRFYLRVLEGARRNSEIRDFLQARETLGHQMKSRIDFVMRRAQLRHLDGALSNVTARENYEIGWSFEEKEPFWFLEWWFSASAWPWWRRYAGNKVFDVVEWGRHARARSVAARMTEHALTCSRLLERQPLMWFFERWNAPAGFRPLQQSGAEGADYEADEDDEIACIDGIGRAVSYRDKYSPAKTNARYTNIFEATVYGAEEVDGAPTSFLARNVLGLRFGYSSNGNEFLSDEQKLLRDWEATDISPDDDRKCNADEWYHTLLWDHWPARVDLEGEHWPDCWGFFHEKLWLAYQRDIEPLKGLTPMQRTDDLVERPKLHHGYDYDTDGSSSDEEETCDAMNSNASNKVSSGSASASSTSTSTNKTNKTNWATQTEHTLLLVPDLPSREWRQFSNVHFLDGNSADSSECLIPKLPCGGRVGTGTCVEHDKLKGLCLYGGQLGLFDCARKDVRVTHAPLEEEGDTCSREAACTQAHGLPQSHLTKTEFTVDRKYIFMVLMRCYFKNSEAGGLRVVKVQDMPRLDIYVAADDWYFLFWLIQDRHLLNPGQYILAPAEVDGVSACSESEESPSDASNAVPASAHLRQARETFVCELCKKRCAAASRFKLLCAHEFCRKCMVEEVPAYDTKEGYMAGYSFRVAEALRTRGIRTPQTIVTEDQQGAGPPRSLRSTISECYSHFVTGMALGGKSSESHDADKSAVAEHLRDPPIDLRLKYKKCPCCRRDAHPGIAEALMIRLLQALNVL